MFSFFKRKKKPEANSQPDQDVIAPSNGQEEEGLVVEQAEPASQTQQAFSSQAQPEIASVAQGEQPAPEMPAVSEDELEHQALQAASTPEDVDAPLREAVSEAPSVAQVDEQLPVSNEAFVRAETVQPEAAGEPGLAEPPAAEPLAAETPIAEASVAEAPASQESATPEAVSPAPEAPAKKTSWLSRLTRGLSRTGQSISTLFVGAKVDEDLYEELETALIMADAGMEATEKLLGALRTKVRKEKITDAALVKAALRDLLAEHLAPLERAFPLDKAAHQVVMIAGVNGAGKTTSIGKLAHTFQANGKKVLLAAGDTFRAAAREQLVVWGQRNNVAVIAQDGGDPAAVAFDAVNAGKARGMDIIMVDTAGRLPTQLHLMEELKKVRRVIAKADAKAPHEVLLVVDGNTGQNALAQIRAFDAAIELTGLVVTKLDGTAKGGVLAAVAAGSQGVRPVPVYWIGVGEGMDDLQPFVAREFAAALVGE